jgi:HSP20 family protein
MGDRETKTPTRWDPFAELDLFRGDPFRELAGRRSLLARLFEAPFPELEAGRLLPALDIDEDESRYRVTVELPGVDKDDVTVEAHDDVLTIRGEKKSEREEKKEKRRWIERRYGSFQRSFSLPPDADVERVSAKFKDGVLVVELPKSEKAKPRTISVK